MIQNREVVTLFSNAQPSSFPSNTAYRFTNRLPHLWKIPSEEEWRVGVSEFSTLNTLDTIPTDLTLSVSIHNDSRFNTSRKVERFQFFMSGQDASEALSEEEFTTRITKMQHYSPNIPPMFEDCSIQWQSFINGLSGVTQQMISQSGYDTYLLCRKVGRDIKLGVKSNGVALSKTRFLLSPALQQLLLLDHPTGVQTLKPFSDLKDRFVYSKDSTYCDFWCRIIPSDHVPVQWSSFDQSVGHDPFDVLKALAREYPFFTCEESTDRKSVV